MNSVGAGGANVVAGEANIAGRGGWRASLDRITTGVDDLSDFEWSEIGKVESGEAMAKLTAAKSGIDSLLCSLTAALSKRQGKSGRGRDVAAWVSHVFA